MSRIVAIVGRPNVGKSTLFNRLTESRDAIVKEVSGVTRDRHYGKSEWCGYDFSVVDTGGYVKGSEDIFEEAICQQVEIAIEEATTIIFLVDTITGITDLDESVAQLLRKSKKPVILASNKSDSNEHRIYTAEFYSLGLGEVFPISANNGSGTGELLDELVKTFDKDEKIEDFSDLPKFAIIGKPNVGKSSIVNALLGEDRNIVTPKSGTTRDAIYTRFNSFGFDFMMVDTAGIRKKPKVQEDIEFYSVLRSIKAIEESDVCIFMVDAQEGIQKQDLNIYYIIEKAGKGVVVLINKWDLVEKETHTVRDFELKIREQLAPFNDVPIIFTSVLNKQRIHKALEVAVKVYENRARKIPTSQLNKVMLKIIENTPPPMYKGKVVNIKFVTQLPTPIPTFAFFCNLPQYVKDHYRRFLENRLRDNFDLEGLTVRIYFRKK